MVLCGKLGCAGTAVREERMATVSWLGPGAKKLVGETQRRNHIETWGAAAGLGASVDFLPLHSALLPEAVW